MSAIGHWIVDDFAKESIKVFVEYSKTLPMNNPKLLPIIYLLLGAKAAEILVDSSKKVGEFAKSTTGNFSYLACKSRTLFYFACFSGFMTMDEVEMKIRFVTDDEFEKVKKKGEVVNDDSQIALTFMPMEILIKRSCVNATLMTSGYKGSYDATVSCTPEQLKDRKMTLKFKPFEQHPVIVLGNMKF
ncbi:MAG: hypothetical protein ACRCXZ_08820 [Patescibacteria group bacterium]